MLDLSEFESISPYTDEEAAEALSKLADYPFLSKVSHQFFPEEDPDFLKNVLKSIKTIDQFQVLVMQKVVLSPPAVWKPTVISVWTTRPWDGKARITTKS